MRFDVVFRQNAVGNAARIARVMLNDARTRNPLHQFKTTVWISGSR
jgi:hypothetical protein